MKDLIHPNIIELKHSFFSLGDKPDEIYLHLVMDFMPETVYRVTKHYVKMKESVPLILVKLYGYQLFRALGYIHAKEVCHRDIKPQNLLLDSNTHVLKLCDFGSAKYMRLGRSTFPISAVGTTGLPSLYSGLLNMDMRSMYGVQAVSSLSCCWVSLVSRGFGWSRSLNY